MRPCPALCRVAQVTVICVFPLLASTLISWPARAGTEFDHAAAFTLSGEFDSAVQQYEAFLDAHPGDRLAPLAIYSLAALQLEAKHDSSAALAGYERLINEYGGSPLAPEAARRRGECFQAMKRWAEAGSAYTKALQLAGGSPEPPPPGWVNEVSLSSADCLGHGGDQEQVIAAYEKVLKQPLSPSLTPAVVFRLARAYELSNREEEAARRYARIVQEYPLSEAFDQAVSKKDLIDRHVPIEWTPYLTFADSRKDFTQGDYAAALRRSEEILATSENPALRLGATFRRIVALTTLSGDYTRGARSLDSLLSGLPDKRLMPNAPRQLETFRGVAEMEAGAREKPDDAQALRNLGEQYMTLRSTTKAIATLEKAKTLTPDDADLRLALGYAYARQRLYSKAEAEFAFYLQAHPKETAVLNQIAYTYLQQGDAEESLAYFRRYVELAPDDPNAHDSLGEGLLGAGRPDEAKLEYEKAIAINPGFTNPYFMLGEIERRLHQASEAKARYQKYLELDPSGYQAEAARNALDELRTE
jgi:tetratricopeptide (TPR) repeat protein